MIFSRTPAKERSKSDPYTFGDRTSKDQVQVDADLSNVGAELF